MRDQRGSGRELRDDQRDRNPIHRDAEFAASTSFGEPIAPGILTAALVAAVIGSELPGPGAVYLSQSLKFLRPVKLNDTITARVEIAEVLHGLGVIANSSGVGDFGLGKRCAELHD